MADIRIAIAPAELRHHGDGPNAAMVASEPVQIDQLVADRCTFDRQLDEAESGAVGDVLRIDENSARITEIDRVEPRVASAADVQRGRQIRRGACRHERRESATVIGIDDDDGEQNGAERSEASQQEDPRTAAPGRIGRELERNHRSTLPSRSRPELAAGATGVHADGPPCPTLTQQLRNAADTGPHLSALSNT